jgi:hypothetical protein
MLADGGLAFTDALSDVDTGKRRRGEIGDVGATG